MRDQVNNLSAVALQRAAADQIRRVEAHRRPPLRLGVPRHCTAQSPISECPRIPETRERIPDDEQEEQEARDGGPSPSVSRSISRRWRRRSRRELTDAVAAACFSLSSATDAIGCRPLAFAPGARATAWVVEDLPGRAHGGGPGGGSNGCGGASEAPAAVGSGGAGGEPAAAAAVAAAARN